MQAKHNKQLAAVPLNSLTITTAARPLCRVHDQPSVTGGDGQLEYVFGRCHAHKAVADFDSAPQAAVRPASDGQQLHVNAGGDVRHAVEVGRWQV